MTSPEKLMWLVSEHIESVNGAVYIMWAELTDAFGLGSAPQRDHAEVLMREAAYEFLDMTDDDAQLDTWAALDAWRLDGSRGSPRTQNSGASWLARAGRVSVWWCLTLPV